MAKKESSKIDQSANQSVRLDWRDRLSRGTRFAARCIVWTTFIIFALFLLLVSLFNVVNPPFTARVAAQYFSSGPVFREQVDLNQLPQHIPVAFIAAEDSSFCQHWGFDVEAIRLSGEGRGATISQQTARNLFLLSNEGGFGRLIESTIAGFLEILMSKRRILEIYLNTSDYGGGVFGVAAAATHTFDKPVYQLTDREAAKLAALFRSNEGIDDESLQQRTVAILDGAKLITKDSRTACIGS